VFWGNPCVARHVSKRYWVSKSSAANAGRDANGKANMAMTAIVRCESETNGAKKVRLFTTLLPTNRFARPNHIRGTGFGIARNIRAAVRADSGGTLKFLPGF